MLKSRRKADLHSTAAEVGEFIESNLHNDYRKIIEEMYDSAIAELSSISPKYSPRMYDVLRGQINILDALYDIFDAMKKELNEEK